jgi:hypothetical protein
MFLLPFIVMNTCLHARATKAQVQMAEAQQKQYELLLAEHNAKVEAEQASHYASPVKHYKVDYKRTEKAQ